MRAGQVYFQIQLERKEDMKSRGEASPDDGDTLAMTFAVKIAAKEKPKYTNVVYSYSDSMAQRWMHGICALELLPKWLNFSLSPHLKM